MEQIVEKIRKLLRLAKDKGATENEAANALAMAQKLMLQHNIQNVEEKIDVQAVKGRWTNEGRDDKWEQVVAQAVAKLFTCRVLMLAKGKYGWQFVGNPANVAVCEETFPWVCDQIEALYKQGLKAFKFQNGSLSREIRGNFRATFKEHCALRIFHRVSEIVAKARNEIPEHMALVVIDQSLAAADDLIKDVRKTKRQTSIRQGLGAGAGYAAGDHVRLQREVK